MNGYGWLLRGESGLLYGEDLSRLMLNVNDDVRLISRRKTAGFAVLNATYIEQSVNMSKRSIDDALRTGKVVSVNATGYE